MQHRAYPDHFIDKLLASVLRMCVYGHAHGYEHAWHEYPLLPIGHTTTMAMHDMGTLPPLPPSLSLPASWRSLKAGVRSGPGQGNIIKNSRRPRGVSRTITNRLPFFVVERGWSHGCHVTPPPVFIVAGGTDNLLWMMEV